MMKTVLSIILLCTVLSSWAQESIFTEIKMDKLDLLIELAKENYPMLKISQKEAQRAKSNVAAAKASYLDIINASYYYRPEERTVANPSNPFIFNGFQFGVSLSPGLFFQKPFQVKEAKAAYEISKLQSQNFERSLANDVKARYYDYVFALSDIKAKTTTMQDALSLLDEARASYEIGEAELSAYNGAKSSYNSATMALKQSEISYLKAKDALELLIGVEISTVK